MIAKSILPITKIFENTRDILKKNICQLCFLDELWQAENWGVEEEAAKKRDKVFKELKKIITLVNCLKEKD